MCLFFMRLTPNSESGYSPFMLAHGWEPNTPSQVLYSAWAGKHLGFMNVEDWVAENAERVRQQATMLLLGSGRNSRIGPAKRETWRKAIRYGIELQS